MLGIGQQVIHQFANGMLVLSRRLAQRAELSFQRFDVTKIPIEKLQHSGVRRGGWLRRFGR